MDLDPVGSKTFGLVQTRIWKKSFRIRIRATPDEKFEKQTYKIHCFSTILKIIHPKISIKSLEARKKLYPFSRKLIVISLNVISVIKCEDTKIKFMLQIFKKNSCRNRNRIQVWIRNNVKNLIRIRKIILYPQHWLGGSWFHQILF
jgi:hypothetical protein